MKLRRLVRRAEEELDRHVAPPHPGDRKYVPQGYGEDVEILREEQAAETGETVTHAGPVLMTSGQWKGLVLGGLVGGVLGVLLLLPVAIIPFVDAVGARLLLVAFIGWVAGATVGAVFWGGRLPELEGETVDVNGRPSIGTSLRDPRTDERGRPPPPPEAPMSAGPGA